METESMRNADRSRDKKAFRLRQDYGAATSTTTFGFAHRSEKCNFIGGIAIIDVVRKPINSLKNSVL